jgi:superoxide oxidase
MRPAVPAKSFDRLSRSLHWGSALLVILALILIESKGFFEKGTPLRELIKTAHFQLGALVFCLSVPRLAWRLTQTQTTITPAPPAWQNRVAHLIHFVFYALLFALPISGVLMLQAKGGDVALLGLSLPALVQPEAALRSQLHELHELMGNAMIVLLGGHIAATLFHHHIQRDDTLLRMLPRRQG